MTREREFLKEEKATLFGGGRRFGILGGATLRPFVTGASGRRRPDANHQEEKLALRNSWGVVGAPGETPPKTSRFRGSVRSSFTLATISLSVAVVLAGLPMRQSTFQRKFCSRSGAWGAAPPPPPLRRGGWGAALTFGSCPTQDAPPALKPSGLCGKKESLAMRFQFQFLNSRRGNLAFQLRLRRG